MFNQEPTSAQEIAVNGTIGKYLPMTFSYSMVLFL